MTVNHSVVGYDRRPEILENIMQTAKQEAQDMIQNLPEGSTFEDIQYHLYVLEKVRRGMESIEKQGGVSQEEAEKRLSRWITK